MGNIRSEMCDQNPTDVWWNNETTLNTDHKSIEDKNKSHSLSPENLKISNEFKMDLALKHEKRRKLIAEKRKEMCQLREDLVKQKKICEKYKTILEQNKIYYSGLEVVNEESASCVTTNKFAETDCEKESLYKVIKDLQNEMQTMNTNIEKERNDYKTHVTALKEVIKISKEMLQMRENQVNELRQKVAEIEASLPEQNINAAAEDLKREYERQLDKMKELKTMYKERLEAEKQVRYELELQLSDTKTNLQKTEEMNRELNEQLQVLEKSDSDKYDKIVSLESSLGIAKAEYREIKAEISIINQLFSNILVGFNSSQDIDFDQLIKLLEENHDLLKNIVLSEESNEISSALPKVLLNLVNQINNNREDIHSLETTSDESGNNQVNSLHQLNSAQEIVENLPKVWRILIELLSHQSIPSNLIAEENQNPCYKQIQTPNGPRLALSVSKTFIRLKDLIVEKKMLEKEMNHMKHLNTHLESRLQDQEKRLELVSNELTKTWNIVEKMQKQHQHLHTQEKILRYELAQKRKMLTNIKEELEFCREKWMQAREKNSSTEKQWKELRHEFALRKININQELNGSVESGYSDERDCLSDEESCSRSDSPSPSFQNIEESNDKISILNVIQQEITNIVESDENSEKVDDELLTSSVPENLTETVENQCGATGSSTYESEELAGSSIMGAPGTFSNREERLKQLEEQTKELVAKVTQTSSRSLAICVKLENLHEQYGQENDENKI